MTPTSGRVIDSYQQSYRFDRCFQLSHQEVRDASQHNSHHGGGRPTGLCEAMLEAQIAKSGGAAVKEQIEKQYGRDAMMANMQRLLASYPNEPVGVGDSWSNTASVTETFPFPVQMDRTYTLKGRAGGIATLSVESTIKTGPNAEPLGGVPAKTTMDISGKQTGEIVVHETAGWTMSSKLAVNLKGNMKMGASGTTVQFTAKVETTVKTTK